ncbi:hypothetical protein RRG08_008310 [Elysia crispata]|uniref:Uncharacterized protein n=1 Tax=Elysia crispata TaxID=231223 RepID=A0AAE0ZMT7_9GAST|nr:hypothetical protein RRG08_008310 [Elysia crispata]
MLSLQHAISFPHIVCQNPSLTCEKPRSSASSKSEEQRVVTQPDLTLQQYRIMLKEMSGSRGRYRSPVFTHFGIIPTIFARTPPRIVKKKKEPGLGRGEGGMCWYSRVCDREGQSRVGSMLPGGDIFGALRGSLVLSDWLVHSFRRSSRDQSREDRYISLIRPGPECETESESGKLLEGEVTLQTVHLCQCHTGRRSSTTSRPGATCSSSSAHVAEQPPENTSRLFIVARAVKSNRCAAQRHI